MILIAEGDIIGILVDWHGPPKLTEGLIEMGKIDQGNESEKYQNEDRNINKGGRKETLPLRRSGAPL
jgi:hypothetical protein